MEKYTLTILLTITFFLIGCKMKNSIHINNAFIKEISQENQNLQIEFDVFFCKCQDNQIVRLTLNQIRSLYKTSTSYDNFRMYITAVLNQRLKIDCNSFDSTFELDPIIKDQYEKKGLDYLLKSFCIQSENDRYFLNPKISKNQLNTVLYYFFINNYISVEDDYLGTYGIIKL
jgi:hypothetical protein